MMSFSIDDVRDTMPREVSAFLARIEATAQEVLSGSCAARAPGNRVGSSLLRAIRHDGHAIYGTSSLVSAKTLAACADLVERLAERGHTELALAEARVARARRVVELLPVGAQQMRTILDLELSHSSDEAEWAAAEWLGSAESLLNELGAPLPNGSLHPGSSEHAGLRGLLSGDTSDAPVASGTALRDEDVIGPDDIEYLDEEVAVEAARPALAEAPEPAFEFAFESMEAEQTPVVAAVDSHEQFSFDDDESEGEAAPLGPSQADVRRELLEIFRQEAREAVVTLQGYLDALGADPRNSAPAGPLERVYHTLKGAAATVGFSEVSAQAEALQHRAEALLVATTPIDESSLGGLVADTNRLFVTAGLDDIRVTARTPATGTKPTSAKSATIRKEFLAEAREIHEQASGLVAHLASPAGKKFGQSILASLAPLFHRLKGSALLADEADVAEIAGSLEAMAEASPAPGTAAFSHGLARIATKLGFAHKSLSGPTEPKEAATLSATRASFEVEAKQLLQGALELSRELDASSDSRAFDAQQELLRLFHHLRGSAGIVGDETVANEARVLEGMLGSGSNVDPAALRAISERLSSLKAHFGSDSSVGSALAKKGKAPTLRERVDVVAAAELWQTFSAECAELMETIERSSLSLEDSAAPKEHLRGLMRMFHTLKGVINTIGLVPTGRALHRVEDLLETLLDSPILPPARSITSLLIEVQSDVRRNLKESREGWVETSPERLEQRISALLAARHEQGQASLRTERTDDPRSAQSSHRSELSVGDGPDRRVIRVSTERLDTLMNLAGELVVSRSRLSNRVERLRVLQSDLVRGSRRLIETVDAFREEHEFANLDGRGLRVVEAESGTLALAAGHDVSSSSAAAWSGFSELELDRYEGIHILTRSLLELTSDFSDMYGQLSKGLSALTDDSDVVGAIVSGIQTEVTQARMVPLEALFMRLRLPLRDAAQRERKEVRVVVRGEDVPVDKSIADALFQPMLHLVRNAVVHGIESAERRAANGKPRAGTIELSARQESGQIVIEVRDDGAGLDLGALRTRGIDMGLLPTDVALDDPSVRELVFAGGLSTHQGADDVAGRGVGGEVAKRAVDRLNGSIRVETTAGQGTAFSIRLPLTLAITRALVVRSGEQSFAIPLHFAERIIDAHEQEVVIQGDLRRIKLDGIFMPIRDLGEFFGALGNQAQGPVLILRVGDARMALQVDQIVAHEEIVVKGLGTLLGGHPTFAGITIRGTGQLVLIVDVPSLVEAKGSTFARRPVAPSRQRAPVPAAAVGEEVVQQSEASTSSAVRVLFVDDSVSVRRVAELQLRELGAEVTLAVDGMDAMSKLREQPFDVLFTDLEMPRMHGYELIRELRFLPAFRELPIIVVTSRSGQKHQEQARQLGANEYITKPFTLQTLEGALKKWGNRDEAAKARTPDESVRESGEER